MRVREAVNSRQFEIEFEDISGTRCFIYSKFVQTIYNSTEEIRAATRAFQKEIDAEIGFDS